MDEVELLARRDARGVVVPNAWREADGTEIREVPLRYRVERDTARGTIDYGTFADVREAERAAEIAMNHAREPEGEEVRLVPVFAAATLVEPAGGAS